MCATGTGDDRGPAPRWERGLCARTLDQKVLATHSEITLVTFGSTAMPGPNVVETVARWM
ncbi:hypothetical protein JOF45_000174 [Nesterenkonia lacusekhoensis]|uniref:Uncharacterized protein n=1 Tax=Nesterenkonia lacusekhoensis TaxID=150832 RepID=A0ABS4SY89_9MICC|nr:hypothetical protein [Nesterenkonia lacusekhoensis]